MYESFFGFRERPFLLTPNPRFLYLNPSYREALATLRYGLTNSLGITLLLGEAGTGKTTLLRAALAAEECPDNRCAVITNPTLTTREFFELLAHAFDLPDASGSKGKFLPAFERVLLERHDAGCRTTLVVDEAQSLTHCLFEEIRLLANFETDTARLFNVVLVGQPELADRLNEPSLRQLKQRVILRCSLPALDLEGTAAYISTRLWLAGGSGRDVFTGDAVRLIFAASRGIPRTISVVCENALIAAYGAQRKPIDRDLVADVCRDFDLPLSGNGGLQCERQPDGSRLDVAEEQPPPGDVEPATRRVSQDERVARRLLEHLLAFQAQHLPPGARNGRSSEPSAPLPDEAAAEPGPLEGAGTCGPCDAMTAEVPGRIRRLCRRLLPTSRSRG